MLATWKLFIDEKWKYIEVVAIFKAKGVGSLMVYVNNHFYYVVEVLETKTYT